MPNPPDCIGNKFKSPGFIKLFCSLNKAQISFIYQVKKSKPLILILFCNRNNKSQVRPCQFLQGITITFFNPLCKLDFFFNSNQIFLPISCKYLSSDALSRFVIDFVIFNCLIFPPQEKISAKLYLLLTRVNRYNVFLTI